MCLLISSDQEQNERDLKKWFESRKKSAYVYKLLYNRPNENYWRSPYHSEFIWNFKEQKVFQVDRPLKPTKDELDYGAIDKGLHVYISPREAKKNKYPDEIIIKLKVLKENIVAIDNNSKQAVCTKLEFVKVFVI
jgi:hypothetical protein